ncbi:MAG: M3 family oligoendopeptidase [Armatimonadetes bacterium]|nr:M3 family oligoendopeptidase [Armatimonadota bacterium]
MQSEAPLPHWEMSTIFPSLESPEYQAAFEAALGEIDALAADFDAHQIRRRETASVDPPLLHAYEEITRRLNGLLQRMRTLGSYVNCHVTTDAANETAQSRMSLLENRSVLLDQLLTRYTAWVGTTDIEALLERSEVARAHAYPLRRAQEQARHQLSEAEEALVAELRPASVNGWVRLHGNMTALLTASVSLEGEEKTLPISAVRALAHHRDRTVRKAAFEAELNAWETVTVPLAAALNGVKGFQRTLRVKRGYADDVEPTLFNNGMDRETLDAMHAACVESFPDFRRYMDAKARALGLDRLAWYDINAPMGEVKKVWGWDEAEGFIRENFGRYSGRMAEFADRSFRERWIDAPPHVGKEGGAYCSGIRPGESRIMMNYDGSFTSVSTLAHELGHAYHNLNLKDRAPMQSRTPSTLAETASIFCETLAFDAAMIRADRQERLALLDTTLDRNLQVVVDIHSRFLFEKGVFEKRAERDLTITEFNELMRSAQRETYGNRLDPLHPYMWAVKGHYYGPTFYNYPYTFGLLFGLGLYARYQEDPDSFRGQYDEFLSSTGLADAATLAGRFGVDIRSVAFWRSSLDVIRRDINDFEELARG